MKYWRKAIVCLIAVFMVSSSIFIPTQEPVEAASSYNSLKRQIDNVLFDSRMKNATSSITIRKASDGKVIYKYYADRGVTPASTMKLLTGAAALETLGENYRFSTTVSTDGKIEKGVLKGNLYVKGQGDPTLLKSSFDSFATALSNQGIKKISGNLYGDDTWYDNVRLSAGILPEDEPYYYAAPISALTVSPNADYDAGSVIVQAKPSVNGKPTQVTLTPKTGVLKVKNLSKTVPKGSKNTLKITRKVGTNQVIITGNAPIGTSGKKEWISVTDPTMYALDIFKRALTDKGIKFVTYPTISRGKTPKNVKVLASRRSMPLKDLMIPFMKLSNNTHAEVLAKEMGRVKYEKGSWGSGLRVMREYIDSIGLNSKKWSFEDASGMSYSNKLTSNELSEFLYLIQKEPWYKTYYKSLPISGNSNRLAGGTLRYRLNAAPAAGNVFAKTGSLKNTKALSGYAQTKGGEVLIFTILTQDDKATTIPSIDRIVTAITNHK